MGKELYKDFFTMNELLSLQLIGYSNADISGCIYSQQEKEALQRAIADSPQQYEKTKRILEKQAQAGVTTISYYSIAYFLLKYNLTGKIQKP